MQESAKEKGNKLQAIHKDEALGISDGLILLLLWRPGLEAGRSRSCLWSPSREGAAVLFAHAPLPAVAQKH